ncbi:Hypothetical predicted protein [Octopus vulgaris]|uniref:Uncharacterized protein n=1 Tax=Octopus vulgaris TaxID=6645 RepID=A0AA36F1Y2_OCTVU|nr:Hypothetical predicted protein [Octopus vulgaris]
MHCEAVSNASVTSTHGKKHLYHCTRRPYEDLTFDNTFFTFLKVINLGVPTLAYGIACWMLVRYHEDVETTKGTVRIYFLNKEEKNSQY